MGVGVGEIKGVAINLLHNVPSLSTKDMRYTPLFVVLEKIGNCSQIFQKKCLYHLLGLQDSISSFWWVLRYDNMSFYLV